MNIEESARKQTAQELKINQSLECPYVVACYQCFYQNEAFSIILEYMDGGSLLDLLGKVKTIPEEYLAAICKQVNIMQLYGGTFFADVFKPSIVFSPSGRVFLCSYA